MRPRIRGSLPTAISFVAALWGSAANADRLAIVSLSAPGQAAPTVEADKLAADLIARGHRVLASADVMGRIAIGNLGAGADWAAQLQESIDAARTALTRLDRALALRLVGHVREDVASRGGGAGGSEVLVSWCLLERQLLLTASDSKAAETWLDRAVAIGPNVELDPLRHPVDDRDRFARRRASLRNELPATLSVASTPAAQIWVDGVQRCESPCTVTLLPGHHFVRVSSAAHQPASFEVDLASGTATSRRLGLSAAYSGASPQAISAMLSDPSRRAEGVSALEPLARFLDVDHALALYPEKPGVRLLISPPAAGRPKTGRAVELEQLLPAVNDELVPLVPAEPQATRWYAKPGTWIVGAGVVASVIGGVLIYGASRPAKTATITVTSSP